jgi:methyl-accepting chemotaxis protein
VAFVLDYKEPKNAISKFVEDDEKAKLKDIKKWGIDVIPHFKEDNNSNYLTESGLYSLVMSSKMEKAKKFRKYITQTILPSLRKNGSYVINPEITDYSKYEIEELSKYYDYKVFYIFYIGFINNKHVFKYGITSNIYKRFRQHRNDFEEYDNNIYPIYVAKCENNREIESAFGDEMIDAGLKLDGREFKSFKGNKTELTTISNVYNIEFLVEKANFLIKNIKSRAMLERDVKEKDKEIKDLKENNKKIISNLEEKYEDLKDNNEDLKNKYEDLQENNKEFINELRERIKELKEKEQDNKDKIKELKNIIKNLQSKKSNFVNN